MEEAVSKQSLLESIQRERKALEATLDKLVPSQFHETGVEGDWTVKDLLWHLSAWQRLLIRWTQALQRGDIPDRPPPGEDWSDLDALNHSMYLENLDRALDETLDEFYASQRDTIELVESLSEDQLFDSSHFAWRQGDPLWHMVAANTWWHDKEHHETIVLWLAGKAS
jgi:hypothetical protein